MTETPLMYPLPKVRVTVNFGDRTDGGPESVEIEINQDVLLGEIGEVVTAAVSAAQKRADLPMGASKSRSAWTGTAPGTDTWITTTSNSAEVA